MYFSDKRAVSTVIASIIILSVAIAVSIALAAWYTGFIFSFAKVEDLHMVNDQWGPGCAYVDLTLRNEGTSNVVLSDLKVNSEFTDFNFISGSESFEPGETTTIRVTYGFVVAAKYSFVLYTSRGSIFVFHSEAKLP